MNPTPSPDLIPKLIAAPFILVLLWLAIVVSASIVFRRSRGKPVLFFGVPNAHYLERTASGCSNRSWWTRLGGASGCLVVAVTEERLRICPFFPFNLMFIPELYGLDVDVPLRSIVSVTEEKGFMRPRIRIHFRNGDASGDVSLMLRDPAAFQRCLGA